MPPGTPSSDMKGTLRLRQGWSHLVTGPALHHTSESKLQKIVWSQELTLGQGRSMCPKSLLDFGKMCAAGTRVKPPPCGWDTTDMCRSVGSGRQAPHPHPRWSHELSRFREGFLEPGPVLGWRRVSQSSPQELRTSGAKQAFSG